MGLDIIQMNDNGPKSTKISTTHLISSKALILLRKKWVKIGNFYQKFLLFQQNMKVNKSMKLINLQFIKKKDTSSKTYMNRTITNTAIKHWMNNVNNVYDLKDIYDRIGIPFYPMI